MLDYPERRIYRAGQQLFAFDIGASTPTRVSIAAFASPPSRSLTDGIVDGIPPDDAVRCDFCAIDMKTDPATGGLVFLELNNGPMFMGYDGPTGGAMAEAMARYLMSRGASLGGRLRRQLRAGGGLRDLGLFLGHVGGDVGEERRREVALAGVGQHAEDGGAFGRLRRRP